MSPSYLSFARTTGDYTIKGPLLEGSSKSKVSSFNEWDASPFPRQPRADPRCSSFSPVLPPIPTTGLTAADVTQLSVDTRELMLKTLRELSEPVSTAVAEADDAGLAKAAEKVKSSSSTSLPIPPGGDPAYLSPAGSVPTPSHPESSGQQTPESSFMSEASAVHVNAPAEASGARDRKISVSSAEGSDDMVMVDRPNSAA